MTYESIFHGFRIFSIHMDLKPLHDDNSGPNKNINKTDFPALDYFASISRLITEPGKSL